MRPERIVEDSRYPADVQCMWPGRLIVHVTVSGGYWSRQLDLEQGVAIPVADGMLTLVDATPRKIPGTRPARLPAMRFTFAFQGGL